MRILMTGGHGMLGTELRKLLAEHEITAPTMEQMDITKPETFISGDFDIVVHCAAYIDLVKAEKEDKVKCYMANVLATKWLSEKYWDARKFVYISSEYAANPVNWYSWTKKWGEDMIKSKSNSLIIRTAFKPRPFKHPKACINQWTRADYIDVIAPLIADAIIEGVPKPVLYVGTDRKTTYELAKQTNPDVIPCLVEDITTVTLPEDYYGEFY